MENYIERMIENLTKLPEMVEGESALCYAERMEDYIDLFRDIVKEARKAGKMDSTKVSIASIAGNVLEGQLHEWTEKNESRLIQEGREEEEEMEKCRNWK